MFRKMMLIIAVFALVAGSFGCAGMTPAYNNDGTPVLSYKELQSDLPPVFLVNPDRYGKTFKLQGGTDPAMVNTVINLMTQKGMIYNPAAPDADYVIDIRPGFIGAFKDYTNGPKFAQELGMVAAAGTHAGLLASGAAGFGRAGLYADAAFTVINFIGKMAEHAATPNVFCGEVNFQIVEKVAQPVRKGKEPVYESVVHQGMLRTSVGAPGLDAKSGMGALSCHVGELIANHF